MKYFSHKSTATYLLNLETASRNGKVLPKNAFSVPGAYLIYNKIKSEKATKLVLGFAIAQPNLQL